MWRLYSTRPRAILQDKRSSGESDGQGKDQSKVILAAVMRGGYSESVRSPYKNVNIHPFVLQGYCWIMRMRVAEWASPHPDTEGYSGS
jgi:hypothetical protein